MIQQSKLKSELQYNEQTKEINSFEELSISHNLLRGIYAYGFQKPSPIQAKTIKPIKQGRDLIGQSQAGTGKTGAFTVGALQRIDQESQHLQVIILTPTRQLTLNIHFIIKQFIQYTRIRSNAVIGGTSVRQNIRQIRQNNPQIIVATPGRCLDFIHRGIISTDHQKVIVLDEADQMLNRGFTEQVKEIFQNIPADTQCLLFSATIPQQVLEITEQFMKNPIKILLKIKDIPIEAIKQFKVCMETYEQKFPTMLQIFKSISLSQSIVFANTKEKVDQIANKFKELKFPVSVIHSGVQDRNKALNQFKCGQTRILISTDLTGRGIDISQVNLVINYDLPISMSLEQYIHRIGRCGRYGKKGVAINLVTEGDAELMVKIQKYYNIEVPELPLDLSKIFL